MKGQERLLRFVLVAGLVSQAGCSIYILPGDSQPEPVE